MGHLLFLARKIIHTSLYMFGNTESLQRRFGRYKIELTAELDQSEIHSFLDRLPNLNMEAILSQAYQFKFEVKEKSLTLLI